MFYLYTILLLSTLVLLSPLWIPLVAFSEKYRHAFRNRAFMPPLHPVERDPVSGDRVRIWIHALSVGEVLSAEPLITTLATHHGAGRLIFTASTRSGYEMALRVIGPHVAAVRYFPYDTPFSVHRAIQVIRPSRVIVVETDIWPVFLALLKRRRIPVWLVNARLSDRSFRGYRRFRFLMRPLLSGFARICVQTDADRRRFLKLGVANAKLAMTGNMKFDQPPVTVSAEAMRSMRKTFGLSSDLQVWVAGSTHLGEEAILANACLTIASGGQHPVLIVAPRDPARAPEVVGIFQKNGIKAQTMAQIEIGGRTAPVVVIDRIGMLRKLYALADFAFVGGSMVAAGGHNPLEPASLACPVLFGPYTDDFRWICQSLEKAGGAIRVRTTDELSAVASELLRHRQRRRMIGRCAKTLFLDHQGAVTRTLVSIGMLTGGKV